jgi:hypothetical protein
VPRLESTHDEALAPATTDAHRHCCSAGLADSSRKAALGRTSPLQGEGGKVRNRRKGVIRCPVRRTPCYPEPTPGTSITLDLIHYRLVSAPESKDGRGWCHAGCQKIIAARAAAGDRNTYPGRRCPEDHSASRAERSTHHPAPRHAKRSTHHPARRSIYPPSCAAPKDRHTSTPRRAGTRNAIRADDRLPRTECTRLRTAAT